MRPAFIGACCLYLLSDNITIVSNTYILYNDSFKLLTAFKPSTRHRWLVRAHTCRAAQ